MVGLWAFATAASLHPAVAQENSSANPAAINSRVRSMIELGSVYTNIYDIAITVLETVRGKEALDRLKAASPNNQRRPKVSNIVLARVKFEFKGRYVSDNLAFDLGNDPLQWVALASDLTEYPKSIADGTQTRTGRQSEAGRFDGRLGCVCGKSERLPSRSWYLIRIPAAPPDAAKRCSLSFISKFNHGFTRISSA